MELDSEPPTDAAVAQGLAALKREGGSVLVVGAATGAQRDVCERFREGEETVSVATDSPVREDGVDAVVERSFPTRSATAANDASSSADVTSLAGDLEAAMREHAREDATLRVCFDSIRPFVAATDPPTLATALSSIRETARETGSVVHLHLPAMPEAVPRRLHDAVDALVEVRRVKGTVCQRWRFPGATGTTDWVEM
jgi:NAD(P)-dependent dehydrogenase (short-subunit alcohol dehydrogenase family)